ncbi:autotransporter domain-containing protein [Variovorax paradoxus]|nr:autotransporter domain-containing protein [Variovorax paradoxus]
MNRSYRSIWNRALGAWVAAPECAKGCGKSGGGVVRVVCAAGLAMLLATSGVDVYAQLDGRDGASAWAGRLGTTWGVGGAGGTSPFGINGGQGGDGSFSASLTPDGSAIDFNYSMLGLPGQGPFGGQAGISDGFFNLKSSGGGGISSGGGGGGYELDVGTPFPGGGGGGGGATAVALFDSRAVISSELRGGNGGAGGDATISAAPGGGGGGGIGAWVRRGALSVAAGASVAGGNGGRGGRGPFNSSAGGSGGTGAHAIDIANGDLTIDGTVRGGTGGDGDFFYWNVVSGSGGPGGAGVVGHSATITIHGAANVQGGSGGAAREMNLQDYPTQQGTPGLGGAGITGSNLTIINSGRISGGQTGSYGSAATPPAANAIEFLDVPGSVNRLTLLAGSNIIGNVVARAADTLELSGSTNDGFDPVPYQGFGSFIKTGSSTWTVTQDTSAVTPWIVREGALSISSDARLGATTGGLALDGGTLQATADITSLRAVVLGASGGSILTDAGTMLRLGGTLSGGALIKNGAGTLDLTSANTYAGGTTVSGGTLRVNNAGGSATGTGAVTVSAAATLAGNGGIAGPVTIANGGHLAPGNSPGTLHTGALTLAPGAVLDYELGQAGTAGGAFNDLINVNGDLALDGTLNVTTPAGGNFGPGVYRLINYTGGLTDNGLDIGSVPGAASQLHVQTSIAKQVNLINGLTLNFWDGGTAGNYNNAAVNGGSGTWRAGAPNEGWTGTDGLLNAPWAADGFAVFQGVPGTVMVDNGNGAVRFSGAQFAVDGYSVIGDALRTDTANTIIRVGDGSSGGATTTAAIHAPIVGSGGIEKQDLGTLIVSGANTYSGATAVRSGTLRTAADHSLSAVSAHTVSAGATLDLAGHSQKMAALDNGGTVSLRGAAPGTTLTVTGAYVGRNGTLQLSTALGASGPSDRLVLDGPGASASGHTSVQISNLGGLGGLTTGHGIEVVSATNGATSTAQTTKDAFSLAGGRVDAGAYEYRLFAADANGAGENWYLRSSTAASPSVAPPVAETSPAPSPPSVPTYRTEVPLFAALPAQLRQADLSMLGNLHRRTGDDDASAQALASLGPVATPPSNERRAWARVVHADLDIRQGGTVSPASKGSVKGVQGGTDLFVSGSGDWRGGIYLGSQEGRVEVSGSASGLWRAVGSTELRARYLGAYATYENATGFYADAVLQYGTHRYNAKPLGGLSVPGKGSSLTAAFEVGQAFALGRGWTLEPQAQLMYRRAKLDDAVLLRAQVQQDDADGWIAGLGLRVKGDFATSAGRLQPYARIRVQHDSGGSDMARFIGPAAATEIRSGAGYTAAELSGGFTLSLSRSTSLYGEVGKLFSAGGSNKVKSGVQGSLGVRVRW